MKGREDGPEKAFRVGVCHVYDRLLLFQPFWRAHVARALQRSVLRDADDEFRNSVQSEAAAARIPVVGLRGDCLLYTSPSPRDS